MIWTARQRPPRPAGTERKEAAAGALEHKDLVTFEIKDDAKGEVEAVIATLGVVDKDGDIINLDAIKTGSKVAMSCYGHDAMYGDMPVGKGAIYVDGNKAVFKGALFMDTMRGKETFAVLKGMGGDQQWSFGFRTIGSEVPDEAAQKKGARRILTKLDCFEVSPVIIGAGVGTRTTAVKEATLTAEEKAQADRDAAALVEAVRVKEENERKEWMEAEARAAAELKVLNAIASEEFARFQRTQRRLGAA